MFAHFKYTSLTTILQSRRSALLIVYEKLPPAGAPSSPLHIWYRNHPIPRTLKKSFLSTVVCYWAHILQDASLYISKLLCKLRGLHSSGFLSYLLLTVISGPPPAKRQPQAPQHQKINFSGLWWAIKVIFCRIQVFIYLNQCAKLGVFTLQCSWRISFFPTRA